MLHTRGERIDQGACAAPYAFFKARAQQLSCWRHLTSRGCRWQRKARSCSLERFALARDARRRLNAIPGVYCMGTDQVGRPGIAGYDETRIVITVKDLGYTGYEAEQILRLRYKVQVELADLFNVVALVTIGDTQNDIDQLVKAVAELAREKRPIDIYAPTGILERRMKQGTYELPKIPEQVVTPREAFLADHVEVPFGKSAGRSLR